MNTQLPITIPEDKLNEIEAIKQVIIDFVNPDKIILYGSYARGGYTDQVYMKDGIKYFYISDYDLIVITDKTQVKEFQLADELEKRIKARPDINFFMYDIEYFNKELSTGNYFFVPVYYEGVLLFDKGQKELVEPQPLSIEQIRKNAVEYYKFWNENILEFYETSQDKLQKSIEGTTRPGLTLWFQFQTIEAIYSVLLLVFMGIKPKLHNLKKYRRSVSALSKEINEIFPDVNDSYERRLFDLLNRAYISGKYKMDFEVSLDDVKEIDKRLNRLIPLANQICLRRLESLS
ncbi:nucleotidyltransferase domain-containing protein [Sphingobacterium sp. LRF_L2]|uniref:nucleotidyltransferase domain-containing protein n=1 Tax=Sphingobacterium sp. LRF_L2 TaxID=3369421 RepID=UPI003F606DC4